MGKTHIAEMNTLIRRKKNTFCIYIVFDENAKARFAKLNWKKCLKNLQNMKKNEKHNKHSSKGFIVMGNSEVP